MEIPAEMFFQRRNRMENKRWIYDFVTVGNKAYQFVNNKLKWVIKW